MSPEERKNKQSAAGERGGSRVFIYSEDADLARSLKMLLEDRFEITLETNPKLIAATIAAAAPSLLLVDLNSIPCDITGIMETLKPHAGRLPIIVLYAYQQARPELHRLIESSADLIMFKPCDVEEVGDRIRELLRTRVHPA